MCATDAKDGAIAAPDPILPHALGSYGNGLFIPIANRLPVDDVPPGTDNRGGGSDT